MQFLISIHTKQKSIISIAYFAGNCVFIYYYTIFVCVSMVTATHGNKITLVSLFLCNTSFSMYTFVILTRIYGPRQANLVLIAYASSEGSGKPAHPRSLARTFAARSYKQWVKRKFRQKDRSLAPLNGWACAVKFCHDGLLEDTNSLDGAHMFLLWMATVRFI